MDVDTITNWTTSWNEVQSLAYGNSKSKGFWNAERNDSESLMLMVTELGEACEGLRKGNPPSDKIGAAGFSQVEEELADVIIRIMDMAGGRGLRVGEAVLEKMRYNSGREFLHGKRF